MTQPKVSTPKFLDLNAVVPETDYVVKLNGKEHRLAALSVDAFVENVRGSASIKDSVEVQVEKAKVILQRSFPTMSLEELGSLTFEQLNALRTFAYSSNGQDATEAEMKEEAADGEESPPPAA